MQDSGISEKIRLLETKLRECQINYEAKLDENTERLRQFENQFTELTFTK